MPDRQSKRVIKQTRDEMPVCYAADVGTLWGIVADKQDMWNRKAHMNCSSTTTTTVESPRDRAMSLYEQTRAGDSTRAACVKWKPGISWKIDFQELSKSNCIVKSTKSVQNRAKLAEGLGPPTKSDCTLFVTCDQK